MVGGTRAAKRDWRRAGFDKPSRLAARRTHTQGNAGIDRTDSYKVPTRQLDGVSQGLSLSRTARDAENSAACKAGS
jgi:hypothetical protein